MVQQPRAPLRNDCGLLDRARWMPVTSWPASAARAAATAESTPPDIAASTFIASGLQATGLAGAAGALDDRTDGLDDRVDVGGGGGVAEGEPQRAAGQHLRHAHRQQYVARLRHPRRAGRPGG